MLISIRNLQRGQSRPGLKGEAVDGCSGAGGSFLRNSLRKGAKVFLSISMILIMATSALLSKYIDKQAGAQSQLGY